MTKTFGAGSAFDRLSENEDDATPPYVRGGSDHEAGEPDGPGGPPAAKGYWGTNPGFGKSFIPVWGPARNAVADELNGKPAMATANFVLAGADLIPLETGRRVVGEGILRGLEKAGFKTPVSWTWNASRKRLQASGFLTAGEQEGHHAYIPQGGWGKAVPDVIKNNFLNIKPLEKAVHRRIHGAFDGMPRFNAAQRYWHGTTSIAKTGPAAIAGHAASIAAHKANTGPTRHGP